MLKNGQTHLKNIFRPCIIIRTYQVYIEPQLVPAQHVTDGIETKARYKICRWNAIFQGHTTNSSVVRCTIWYHLYNLKNIKNTQGRNLFLVKLQAEARNFTKSNTPP